MLITRLPCPRRYTCETIVLLLYATAPTSLSSPRYGTAPRGSRRPSTPPVDNLWKTWGKLWRHADVPGDRVWKVPVNNATID